MELFISFYKEFCVLLITYAIISYVLEVYLKKDYGKIAMFLKTSKIEFYVPNLDGQTFTVTRAWYLLPLPENVCIFIIWHIAHRRACRLLKKMGIKPKKAKWKDVNVDWLK